MMTLMSLPSPSVDNDQTRRLEWLCVARRRSESMGSGDRCDVAVGRRDG